MVKPIDLDTLSDEEVMALGPEEMETIEEQENKVEVPEEPVPDPVVTIY